VARVTDDVKLVAEKYLGSGWGICFQLRADVTLKTAHTQPVHVENKILLIHKDQCIVNILNYFSFAVKSVVNSWGKGNQMFMKKHKQKKSIQVSKHFTQLNKYLSQTDTCSL